MRRVKNNGHTITEVMTSMAIFTFLIAGVYGTLYVGNNSWAVQDASVNAQDQARRALGKLSRDLRVAQGLAINEVVQGNDTTIDVSFSRAGEGNITYDWTTVAGATQYQLIRTDSNGAIITAQDISALSFTETASDIKVDLTVSVLSNLQQTVNYSLVGNIALR